MTTCNGCGRCCNPVVLAGTLNDVALGNAVVPDPETLRWIREDLTPLRRREGLFMVRDYMTGYTNWMHEGKPVVMASHFYSCKWYDHETNQCTNYDNRPPPCRGYPWADKKPDPAMNLPPECSFNADIGQPVKLIQKEVR